MARNATNIEVILNGKAFTVSKTEARDYFSEAIKQGVQFEIFPKLENVVQSFENPAAQSTDFSEVGRTISDAMEKTLEFAEKCGAEMVEVKNALIYMSGALEAAGIKLE